MPLKQISGWQASDGKIFDDHAKAKIHQDLLDVREKLDKAYIRDHFQVDEIDDLLDFIILNYEPLTRLMKIRMESTILMGVGGYRIKKSGLEWLAFNPEGEEVYRHRDRDIVMERVNAEFARQNREKS